MAETTNDEKPRRQVEKMTLRKAFFVFFSHPSPRLLVGGLLLAWSLRLYLGGWTIWDAVIIGALIAVWPIVEWVIHVFILHFRPFEFAGRRIDFHLARKHRSHHRQPDHLPHVFIPFRSLLLTVPILLVPWWFLAPTPQIMVTGAAALFTMGTIYEWCHFLIHTNYRAKTRLFKKLWRHHRLHHFKHEQNWFGVSMTLGDRLLGTAPDFRTIETSDTCRTLGVDGPLEELVPDPGESSTS